MGDPVVFDMSHRSPCSALLSHIKISTCDPNFMNITFIYMDLSGKLGSRVKNKKKLIKSE